MTKAQPPKFIVLEDDSGDEHILRWPEDPEGMIEISTWRAVKFLLKVVAIICVGTWLTCWLIWG